MATLPTKAGAVTLLDYAKALDPDGKVARTIDILSQTNEIIDDMLWMEGNLPTGHRTTIRVGLPTAVWRQLYAGVPPSKGIRAQVDDACGMLEARAEVDVDLASLNGNAQEYRMSEAGGFLESMNQSFAQTLFYGDTRTNPERFLGLAPRYSSLSATNGQNIISMSGSSNANNSIWLVGWSEDTVTGIYPKGSTAGLQHWDLGEGDAFDGSNNRYRAYMDRWQWKCGLTVRDWRYIVRICNIDQTAILADTTGGTIKILEAMLKAIFRIPSIKKCRPAFYVNRTIAEMLAIQAMNKSANVFGLKQASEQFASTSFMNIPIRMCDQLLSTEANVA
jgi:hypothetical protein